MPIPKYFHGHLNSYRLHILILVFLCLKFSFLGIHQLHQDVSCLESPEMPPPKDLKQWETSSPFPQVSFPFHLVNSNKSFMSSVHMKEKRVMNINYMPVQMKRGVAILWDTEEGLEPPSKKIRIEEMTYPE